MNLGQYIKETIENQGRTITWVADQIKMNRQTLSSKLSRNGVTGEDLLKLGKLLGIDLNKMKEGYQNEEK